ncbi:hypothetical protein PSPO_a1827 [Pseudoalteromonas spongiae UST010723-006]|nr:hypothetical protein PSPO_a1827 [Pseudoalteromonas spongiae UST010723-006]
MKPIRKSLLNAGFFICSLLGSVDLLSSFLQQFDWVLYKAEAAWHSYSM